MIFSFSKARRTSSVIKRITGVLFFLLLIVLPLKSQRKFLHFYKDTVVKRGDYTIFISKTYLRGSLFLKSTITINNPTDDYLVLDYRAAYAIGKDGIHVKFCNNEDPVFLPKGSYMQRLKFKATPKSNAITFHFPRVYVTSRSGTNYESIDVQKKIEATNRIGNVSIEVLKITYFEEQCDIRVRIRYEGEKFLAINFKNISINGDKSGKIFNKVKPNHRMHHRESKYLEMATLKFPIRPGEKLGNMIHFENVFKEHVLRDLEDFEISYTVQLNEGSAVPTEEDLKKQEKKEEE